jgi:hypothetical protein
MEYFIRQTFCYSSQVIFVSRGDRYLSSIKQLTNLGMQAQNYRICHTKHKQSPLVQERVCLSAGLHIYKNPADIILPRCVAGSAAAGANRCLQGVSPVRSLFFCCKARQGGVINAESQTPYECSLPAWLAWSFSSCPVRLPRGAQKRVQYCTCIKQ